MTVRSTNYDAIVIGAGLGGLVTAALLAKRKLRVLIFDKHYMAGGFATSFYRKSWEFDVSLHCLSGAGDGGPAHKVLQELGLLEKLHLHFAEVLYKVELPGLTLSAYADCSDYLRELTGAFPEEEQGLIRFVELLSKLGREANNTYYRDYLQYSEMSLQQLYEELKLSPKLQSVLSVYCMYLGLSPAEVSVMAFSVIWADYHLYGGCYPKGKSRSIADQLRGIVESQGGTIALREEVTRILVHKNQVKGVQTRKGTYESKLVVSNTDPKLTLNLLSGEQEAALPTAFTKKITGMRPSCSGIQLYTIVKGNFAEMYGETCHEIFLFEQGTEFTPAAAPLLSGDYEQMPLCVTIYENIVPGYNGSHEVTTLTAMLLCGNDSWASLEDKGSYRAEKERVTEILLSRLERRYPGIRKRLEYTELATPKTILRYTGHSDGAIYGASQRLGQTGHRSLSPKSPVEGLYFAGAWTRPGSGYSGVMQSGYRLVTHFLEPVLVSV